LQTETKTLHGNTNISLFTGRAPDEVPKTMTVATPATTARTKVQIPIFQDKDKGFSATVAVEVGKTGAD
jgi:hypothetical protein